MRKKQKGYKTTMFMTLFIIFIMAFSVLGYMWGSSKTRLNYNGHKFYSLEYGGFVLNLEGERMEFNYYPIEIEWIIAPKEIGKIFDSPMVYMSYVPNSTYAETIAEIQFDMAQRLDKTKGTFIQNAFTEENEYGLPIATCAGATPNIPVVIFEKLNETKISFESNCVTVNFKNKNELIMAYERLLYSALGVME